jgi:type I restriction enzyme S subunit
MINIGDWDETSLEDLVDGFQYGLTAKADEYRQGYRFLRITDIQGNAVNWDRVPGMTTVKDQVKQYELRRGDFVFARSGATVGKALRIDDAPRAVFASYLIRFAPKNADHSDWLKWFLRSPQYFKQVKAAAAGIGMPNVSAAKLAKFRIPMPPIETQREIVANLEVCSTRAYEAGSDLQRVLKLVAQYRTALLRKAFAGQINVRGVDRSTWRYARADDVCEKVQSGGTPKSATFSGSGIPFLKVYNIVEQKVDFDYRPQFVPEAVHRTQLRKSIALPGDVVMNIVGPPLGKVAIIPSGEFEEWNLNQALTLFRPSEFVSSKWLYYFLCSGESVETVVNETRGSTGQVNISLSQCRNFRVPVPPREQQDTIVDYIDRRFAEAENIVTDVKAAQRLLAQWLEKTLQDAFGAENMRVRSASSA